MDTGFFNQGVNQYLLEKISIVVLGMSEVSPNIPRHWKQNI
jgi:hypothetical protein